MKHSLLLVVVAAALSTRANAIDTNIKNYVCQKLDDFTATMVVGKADQKELAKISKDFGLLYRIKNAQVRYKEPNQVRIEGAAEGSKLAFIVAGTKQIVMVNGRKLSSRTFTDAPGKRKSLMDVGLLSEYYLTYADAKYLREANVDGVACAVFEMRYDPKFADTSHHNIFIDPATKVVRRRESFSQEGKLQAVYFFRDPKQIAPGIWFPSKIEAQNVDRIIAGSTEYRDIKVNTGLSDSVFNP